MKPKHKIIEHATVPLYSLPMDATLNDRQRWFEEASNLESTIEVPCVVELEDGLTSSLYLRDRHDAELVAETMASLWSVAQDEERARHRRWLTRAYAAFDAAAKASDQMQSLLKALDLPTTDSSAEWWHEAEIYHDSKRPDLLRGGNVEEQRQSRAGPPRPVRRLEAVRVKRSKR